MNRKTEQEYQKVLVFFIGLIGDAVLAVPAVKEIRRIVGLTCRVDLLHERYTKWDFCGGQFFKDLGLVDGMLAYRADSGSRTKARDLLRVLKDIKNAAYDAIFYVMPSRRSLLSVRRDRLYFRMAGIRNLYGFCHFSEESLHPRGQDGTPLLVENEAKMYLRRLESDGFKPGVNALQVPVFGVPEAVEKKMDDWLIKCGADPGKTMVAIGPGTKQPAKAWSRDRFLEVGRYLMDRWNCTLLVVGGRNEKEVGRYLVDRWKGSVNAAGECTLLESAALLKRSRLLVGLDTGTTHMAAAIGTPCVAIYSCHNWPGRWDPLGRRSIIIRNMVPCAGCRLAECPVTEHPCMSGIDVRDVEAGICDLLSRDGEPCISC